jgi:hypothetical protein
LYAWIKAESEEYSSSINDKREEACWAELSMSIMASVDLIENEEHDSTTCRQAEKTREYISFVGCGVSFQNAVGENFPVVSSLMTLVLSADFCSQSHKNTLRPSTSFKHTSKIRLQSLALSCRSCCVDMPLRLAYAFSFGVNGSDAHSERRGHAKF